MEDMWERRYGQVLFSSTFADATTFSLWHQLTNILLEFFQHRESAPARMSMYTVFVSSFQDKINQLKLAILGLQAARQCSSSEEALEFLDILAKKVDTRQSQDAHIYVLVEIARVRLMKGELDDVKSSLDSISKTIDSFDTVEPIIHASYYQVTADFYKAKADYAVYYRNSLRYLACINVADLSGEEIYERVHDLSIAALLGDTIYNFGELLLHPILEAISNTPNSWLRDLLFVVNAGNISGFEGLAGNLIKEPILQESLPFLRQKICLTALTEAVFKRPPNNRILSFDTIANETRLLPEEVEHLVMKALSLGLIRGNMDQVSETCEVTWVQSRVLERPQIASMSQKFRDWVSLVDNLEKIVHSAGSGVWATTVAEDMAMTA
ncbi:putative 26S proteasome regulatory subunit rpn9 [Neolecta irregularis DAH-3]|uniref:Putative 26S proteasome regulatory subunit rpn9 n=1 Tax=Neolecta irregularis (strain DAH-3) TaxID=1198029 RepID=A0A1U7LGR4_NEOID|nr:putative 26S proteasome regulatory subunit rpn9 [Neolecta irregularis DAH-3]|eukprot:OLL21850.1 putative 26S proteasome regulatory subunit rpn9 [Neolecta irregularis DAH-3]